MWATTRNHDRASQFADIGLKPIVLDTTDESTTRQLLELTFDTVVIAVGMDRTQYKSVHDVYVGGLQNVLNNLSSETGQVIYISSTGVYGDFGGAWVNENSATAPIREGGKACLAAEQVLLTSQFADQSTILRMAGLYGNDRVPTKSTVESKQWDKLSPHGYLNLIHIDDAVNATCVAADQSLLGELFLVADSNPSLRRDYYQYLADLFGLGPIPWTDGEVDPNSRGSASKRISNRKLLEQTGLELIHTDFRSGIGSV